MAVTLDIIDEMFDIDLHDGLLSETVEWDGVSIHHPQIHDPGIQYERLCLSLRIDIMCREGLVSQKVMRFSHLTFRKQTCLKRYQIKTNLVSVDRP